MKIKLNLPEKTLIPLRDGTYFFYDSCENEIDINELLRIVPGILPYLEEVSCDDEKTYEKLSTMLSSYKQVKVLEPTAKKTTKTIKEDLNNTKEETKQEETEETKTTTRKRTSTKKQQENPE